jgi:hypothetical protein
VRFIRLSFCKSPKLPLKTALCLTKQQLSHILKIKADKGLHGFVKNTKMRPAMTDAGWSSLVARRAHNPKVVGSNPAPATKLSSNSQLNIANLKLSLLLGDNSRTRDGAAW